MVVTTLAIRRKMKWNSAGGCWYFCLFFSLERPNCNSSKKCFYCSFLFIPFQHLFTSFFCIFYRLCYFFVWYCWFYSFFLFFAILCFSCSIRFIVKWKRQNAPLVSGLWYNRHWNERRELCLPSARTMKNRLKFPLKEVQEKWYAQLLAAICQIHCICNGKEREKEKVN